VTDDVRKVASDTETQRLRRPATPAWPGPLDQTRSPQPAPVQTPETEVLSIHDLMETAPVTSDATVVQAAPATPIPVAPTPTPTPVAAPAVTPRAAASGSTPRPTRRPTVDVGQRLRSDGAAALSGARRSTEDWLRAGDHALAVATALVTLVLLVVVATVA
jgi:hypothetical protein